MENILAILVVLAMVGIFWYTLTKIIHYRQEQKRLKEETEARIARLNQEAAEQRKILREDAKKAREYLSTRSTPAPKKVVDAPKPSYAPSSTQSIRSYDNSSSDTLSDLANLAIIANTVHHWNDSSRSEPVREERSVSVSKTESSWGFDDSDSRKSISSSMDTSSSWSSSSSDSYSSSSSDSGPSSDW